MTTTTAPRLTPRDAARRLAAIDGDQAHAAALRTAAAHDAAASPHAAYWRTVAHLLESRNP